MASTFSGKAGRNASIMTGELARANMYALQDIYGGAKTEAGGYLTDAFGQGKNALQTAFKGGMSDLTSGRTAAQKFLQQGMNGALARSDQGFNTARGDISGARDQALQFLTGPGGAMDTTKAGYSDALQALQQFYGQAGGQLQGAADAWKPLVDKNMAGLDMYNNAMGLNGAQGRDAALDAFQAGPGYQWTTDEATDAAQRAANRTGSAGGGNALDAVTRLSMNLANNEWGSHLDRLQGYQGAAQGATAGMAGALTNLGNLYAQQGTQTSGLQAQQGRDLATIQGTAATTATNAGQNMAQLAANQGTQAADILQQGNTALATNSTNYAQLLANLRGQYGLNQTNLSTQYGGAMAGLTTGTAQGMADAQNNYSATVIPALQQGMMAGQQAAANKMGAVMGGLQLAGQAVGAVAGLPVAGGGSLGGNFLSSLFGK